MPGERLSSPSVASNRSPSPLDLLLTNVSCRTAPPALGTVGSLDRWPTSSFHAPGRMALPSGVLDHRNGHDVAFFLRSNRQQSVPGNPLRRRPITPTSVLHAAAVLDRDASVSKVTPLPTRRVGGRALLAASHLITAAARSRAEPREPGPSSPFRRRPFRSVMNDISAPVPSNRRLAEIGRIFCGIITFGRIGEQGRRGKLDPLGALLGLPLRSAPSAPRSRYRSRGGLLVLSLVR